MFNKMQFPVAPGSLDVKIDNKNKTINLINQSEVNLIKPAGLSSIKFDVLLPNSRYPFAMYKNGEYKSASYFLKQLEKFKNKKEPFQFIVTRTRPNGNPLWNTNMKVTLEDYSIKEDADNGLDIMVSINLKQYREYGTKIFKPSKKKPDKVVKKKPKRPDRKSPAPKKKNKTYKVKKGDCLWLIARRFYGKGSKWPTIYNANKKKIKNPNLIYPGQVFVIPALRK